MPIKDPEIRREHHREYMRGWYQKNKAKHISYVRKRDRRIGEWFKEYKKSLSCESCGENHPACLDFHHERPEDKKFDLGRPRNRSSFKVLKAEIAKCRVLCSNCHRKEHWNQMHREKENKGQVIEDDSAPSLIVKS